MQLEISLGQSSFSWSVQNDVSASLHIDNSKHCAFNQFLKILSGETFNLIPQKYLSAAEYFVSSSQILPLLMPKEELKTALKCAEQIFSRVLRDQRDKDYLAQWEKIHRFLSSLQVAKVDATHLKNIMSEHDDINVKCFESFLPDETGFCKKVVYSSCDSVTGRTTVLSGPQILTTHHDVRRCLRSSYESGCVMSVDFTSIEPRIAMMSVGKEPPVDVYQDLLDEFPKLTRQAAKLVMLSSLYGGKAVRVSESAGDIVTAKKAMSFVKQFIGVEKLERTLNAQASAGLVRNMLGRPLREATKNPRIRTNHFLQSSAAELSILLFAQLCDKFDSGVRPLFVVHDALIVDVADHKKQEFMQAASDVKWNNAVMPVKIEILSDT